MRKLLTYIKKYISLILIYLFNLFPIKRNKIFFFSYYGSQYGDSPKYITEYILKHYPSGYFDIVWAFNDPKTKVDKSFKKVKTGSIRYFYELCTSKVIITNFRTTDLFIKRENQYYIQTWHSSLRLKQIEKDAETSLPESYIKMAKKDSQKCDLLLSGCRYSTEIFKRAFWYSGQILESGTPANDLLSKRNQSQIISNVYERLNIPMDYKIVLYAPTFRNNKDLSVYNLDFEGLIKSLEKRFGGKWICLLRLHPHLSVISKEIEDKENVMNVTNYDDIQELLLISDTLITDYSAVMFSYSLLYKPCFLYVPDIEDYLSNDRKLYFDLEDLPFPNATNKEDLFKQIELFDIRNYSMDLSSLLKEIGTCETGNASEMLLMHIEEVCFGKKIWRGINEAI